MEQDTNYTIQKINEAVDAYFEAHLSTASFAAKKLMPALIENGLFDQDKKNGMPLRQLLRSLDIKNELDRIPRLYVERVGEDIYWYFLREGAEFVSNHVSDVPNTKQKRAQERLNSDEVYLMDLIDAYLKATGSRKHTFDNLLGDLHQDGKTRTKLPIDLYYDHLKLAIEFVVHPNKKKNANKSREEKLTVSGISRAGQRLLYYDRKKEYLTKKDITFIDIPLDKFESDAALKFIRNHPKDVAVIAALLSEFID